jgi:hypothetical protein
MKSLGLLLACLFATSSWAAFKCVDEKGRTHIGDTPPAGCAKVVMYEITRSGQVIRTIQPSMTEEQVRAKLEAEEKARAAERAAAEQKRKDMALLSTYANEREFDVARDRNIEPINQRIKQSNERVKDIDKRIKVVKEEMEFYTAGKKKGAKGGMPPGLAAELERLEEEKRSIARNLANYDREIAELRAKYEADKKRWVALKQGGGKAPEEPKAEPAKAEAKSAGK